MSSGWRGSTNRSERADRRPHEGGSRCRKPETGIFEDAAADFGLRLEQTAVIGDQPSDMEAARADRGAWLGGQGHLAFGDGIVKGRAD